MKDIFWVERGGYRGTCCGFNRKRKSMEYAKTQPNGCDAMLDEAIAEFFRNSKCDCQTKELSTETVQEIILDIEALV